MLSKRKSGHLGKVDSQQVNAGTFNPRGINMNEKKPSVAAISGQSLRKGSLTLNKSQNDAPVPKMDRSINEILKAATPKLAALFDNVTDLETSAEVRKLAHCMSEVAAIEDDTLMGLLDIFKKHLEQNGNIFLSLLQRILDSQWTYRSSSFVKNMQSFVSELLVAQPNLAGLILRSMILKFLPKDERVENPDIITPKEQKAFKIALNGASKIITAFPRMKESCIKSIGAVYPFMGKPPRIHYCLVRNILELAKLVPTLKVQLISLIIHKLSRVDVNISRLEVAKLFRTLEEKGLTTKLKCEDGGVMNLFDQSVESNSTITVLDVSLKLLFEFLEHDKESFGTNEDKTVSSEFLELCETFKVEVLPSTGVNHVQFYIFYLSSLSKETCLAFLEFLWNNALNINNPTVVRMQCSSYIAGFLCRSKIVTVKTVKRWLTKLSNFAHSYIDKKVHKCHWSCINIGAHGFFYSVCQAIFYIFAFRNKDIIGEKKSVAFTNSLSLGSLVTCELNPLKACSASIAESFVRAAHFHEISYCGTILERNQRVTVPTIISGSMNESSLELWNAKLEAFFPFDPYLLYRSKSWIDSVYSTYEPYLPEVKMETESTESFLRVPSSCAIDEDSIEMDLSQSLPKSNGFESYGFACFLKNEDLFP